jgi:hypothetical protein
MFTENRQDCVTATGFIRSNVMVAGMNGSVVIQMLKSDIAGHILTGKFIEST